MYGVEIESRISADRNVGDERTGASEVCEEDGRYEEKICQQKPDMHVPLQTLHWYILLPVFSSL